MKTKKMSVLALACGLCLVVGLTAVFGTSVPAGEPEDLLWPAEDCDLITRGFGERIHPVTGETSLVDHITISKEGISAEGAPILAVKDGVVTEAGFDEEKGNYLVIDHGDGLVTEYTHCLELLTEVEAEVERGEQIAVLGSTGMATGPCLGFYIIQDGEAVDPVLFY